MSSELTTPTPSSSHKRAESHDSYASDTETPSRGSGIRSRISALKDKARIQDHLVEKLLAQVVPLDDADIPNDDPLPGRTAKPNFTLPTMSNNFRRFTRASASSSSSRPASSACWRGAVPHTPSPSSPFSVLVPSFVARHPAAEFSLTNEQAIGYSAGGPPIAPAVTVKPVKELSRDFFHNMRDLQNCMEDFSQMHDAIVRLVVPRTNFSNEAQSSALFVVLFATCLFMSIAANIMPWRLIFLTAGWAVTCVGHPVVQRQLETAHKKHVQPQEEKAMTWVEKWVDRDVILDSAPESREVEIFELQRLSGAGEWEPWLFSASPYDPLSPGRIAAERPVGTRFFEDVQPPQGWEWSEKKWALDLWSREWVEERIITGVEIETEGERWVYDIYDEQTEKIGVIDGSTLNNNKGKGTEAAAAPAPKAELGGRRGWRRQKRGMETQEMGQARQEEIHQ
ncbi:hypothetical protein CIB48_g6379 [Xylaria polymorpha]|nr:hypothetical protein CIB48_g6379 [Xylaria polymorpha]